MTADWRGEPQRGTDGTEDAVLEQVREALRGMRFGQVTLVVHDGAVVQVERTEKFRVAR